MKLIIINGPNLGRLGSRLPHIYGNKSMTEVVNALKSIHPEVEFIMYQSNSEGDIIDCIERFGYQKEVVGMVINPGAYTHYSYAIADALEAVSVPVVEVHISNIAAREEFRSRSVTARHCRGVISGLGIAGYTIAAEYLLEVLSL